MKRNIFSNFCLPLILLLGLAACNMPGKASNATATLNVTQAYQTVEARLTQAILASPPSPTVAPPTATQAVATTETSVATIPSVTPSPQATSAVQSCDQAEAGSPIDVTVPDDTQMTPGQSFTKTWRLRNSGTCSWSKDYSISVFSGEAMNAPSKVPLPNKFDPGQSMDISVDLVAPITPGTYQSNWKLRNASGTWFGIGPGGSSPFWVRIKVVSNGTVTVTAAPTATPTATSPNPPTFTPTATSPNPPTFTPTATSPNPYPLPTEATNLGFQVSGSNSLATAARINLDTNQVNPGGGATTIANLVDGLYICYRTDQGLYGWLRIQNFNANNGTLAVQINTWALP